MHEKGMRSKLQATGAGTQQKGGMEPETSAALPGEIMWVGESTCRRNVHHYTAFRINGVLVPQHSFCYIMIQNPEGTERLVAYIVDLYEDRKSCKKMKVQWLHKAGEIEGSIPSPEPLANEVFMTKYFQVYRLECCDGVVDVVTPVHFEECMPTLANSGAHVYVCGRQFDEGEVKPFDVSSVRGYWRQKIFSSNLIPQYLSEIARANTDFHRSEQPGTANLDEHEQAGSVPVVKSGPKAARSSRRRPVGRYDSMSNERDWTRQQENGRVSCDTVDAVTSSMDKLLNSAPFPATDSGRAKAKQYDLGTAGTKVEILSQDSGMRGCWFICTVMERKKNLVKVSYDDILTVDTDEKLEEWIPISKTAAADQLGIRIRGRRILRPSPSEVEMLSTHDEGCAVDAWKDDGWWEGIFMGRDASGKVKVTFPAEQYAAWFDESRVRISREWVHGQWMEVRPHADIINRISGLHTERPLTNEVQESCPEFKRILSPDFLSGIEPASQFPQLLQSDQEGEGNPPSEGREDNPPDEVREGIPSDQGVSQQAALEYQANKVLALHYEQPFINQAFENMSEKVKSLYFNLNSATCLTATQAPNVSESKEGTTLLKHFSKWSEKRTEAYSAHYEGLDSDYSRLNSSENYGSSQHADLLQLDVDRDKENNTVLVERTPRGLGLISKSSRKRPRDMDSSIFVRSTKSGLFPSRDPISKLLLNPPKEQEDLSLGVLTLNKLTEIGNVEVNRSQYGFEQVNSSTGASVGGPLFNSVSVQNLVLSR